MLLQGFCWCFIYFIREVWLFTLHSSLFCAPDDPQQFGVLGVFFSLLFTHIWQFYFWAGVKKTELCFKDRSWFFFTIPALFCIQNSAYFHTFYSNRSGWKRPGKRRGTDTDTGRRCISCRWKGTRKGFVVFWQARRSSYWTYKFGKEAIIIECFFTSRALTFHILYGTSSFFLCKFPISAFYFSIYRPYTG